MSKYVLKLYINGRTQRSETAIANLQKICETDLSVQYEIEIVDVLEWPQLAEDEKIMVTPLLIKHLPIPTRRLVGDLSNMKEVLQGLNLIA